MNEMVEINESDNNSMMAFVSFPIFMLLPKIENIPKILLAS